MSIYNKIQKGTKILLQQLVFNCFLNKIKKDFSFLTKSPSTCRIHPPISERNHSNALSAPRTKERWLNIRNYNKKLTHSKIMSVLKNS